MPPSAKFRPDFMATGPHVHISKDKNLNFQEGPQSRDDEGEEGPSYRYYESTKVLGKLFRAIDEREILFGGSDRSLGSRLSTRGRQSVLKVVWDCIQRQFQL